MEQKFNEFNEIKESDKSMKHELESIERSFVSHVSCWHCGSISVYCTRGSRLEPFTVMTNIFVTEFAEFIENI